MSTRYTNAIVMPDLGNAPLFLVDELKLSLIRRAMTPFPFLVKTPALASHTKTSHFQNQKQIFA